MQKYRNLLIVFAFIALAAVDYYAFVGIRTTRPEQLRSVVARDLKPGASPDEVIQFLNSHGLHHSPVQHAIEKDARGNQTVDGPIVVGVQERSARGLFWVESLQVVFVFDHQDKLLRFNVRPFRSRIKI